MSEANKPFPDPLVRQRMFPDAAQIFEFAPTHVDDALRDGIVVVDTNVLVVPYTTGRASLEQIRRTYERLTKEDRLRIPGQVAREFADNRAEKLKTLFQQLSRKRDINVSRSEYPLLESLPEYSEVVQRELDIINAITAYRKAISTLLDTVAAWHWDDPVSVMYRALFTASMVVDPEIDRDSILQELKYRQQHRIPPGYKDASNEYSGIGDLLIWKTLLQIGRDVSRHLIFVSGDEKTDWRYQSENRPLYPRFELLEEYRIASGGKSLLIVSFAELLERFGAPAQVVAEVRQEESAASLVESPQDRGGAVMNRAFESEDAVYRWLSTLHPSCKIMRNQNFPDFLVHTDSGVLGYEVKYAPRPELWHRRIRDAMRHGSRHGSRITRMTLVLVVGPDTDQPPPLPSRMMSIVSESGFDAIVIGRLTVHGNFEVLINIARTTDTAGPVHEAGTNYS